MNTKSKKYIIEYTYAEFHFDDSKKEWRGIRINQLTTTSVPPFNVGKGCVALLLTSAVNDLYRQK